MKLTTGIILFAINIITLPFTTYECFRAIRWAVLNPKGYGWFAGGFLLFFLLRFLLKKNYLFLQVFTHEVTHAIFSIFQGGYVKEMVVNEDFGGHVKATRINMLTSLAPYCIPIFTYAILIISYFISKSQLYLFDLLAGATLLFHLFTMADQTGNRQTDIQEVGFVRSYVFIAWMHTINIGIILISIRYDIVTGFLNYFKWLWQDAWRIL